MSRNSSAPITPDLDDVHEGEYRGLHMSLDAELRQRLRSAGVDPNDIEDPDSAWGRLHEHYGLRATLLDRYALEAARYGVAAEELDPEQRAEPRVEVLLARDPGWQPVEGSERRRVERVELVAYDPSWPQLFELGMLAIPCLSHRFDAS